MEIPPPQYPLFPFIPLVPKQALMEKPRKGTGGRDSECTALARTRDNHHQPIVVEYYLLHRWQTSTWKKMSQHCSIIVYFRIPFLPLTLAAIKGGGGQPFKRLDICIFEHSNAHTTLTPHSSGTWAPFPSPDYFVPPTTNNLGIRTPPLEIGRRVLLSGSLVLTIRVRHAIDRNLIICMR
jgi:hypothetical protein